MTTDGGEGTNQPEPGSNPYAAPAAALDAVVRLPAALRPQPSFFWFASVLCGMNAACALTIVFLVVIGPDMLRPGGSSMKVDSSLQLVCLATIVETLLLAALAVLFVRQAIARREPLIRPCREGLVLRTVSRWSGRVTTFYVPWPELVSAEVRGTLGRKRVVVLTRVEPYEIRFTGFDFPMSRPRTVAATIVALARDEAAHAALPGWDRPAASRTAGRTERRCCASSSC
jgi:hypothetical protein